MEKLENNKKYIVIFLIAVLIGTIFFVSGRNRLEVNILNPAVENISKITYVDASLKSDEEVDIYSKVNGQIGIVKYKVGDLVNKGDVLYELDKESIKSELEKLNEYIKKEEKNIEKMKINITEEEVQAKSEKVDKLEEEVNELRSYEAKGKIQYEMEEISLEEYQNILENKIKKEGELSDARRDFQDANRALIQNLNMESMGKVNELRLQKKNLEKLIGDHTVKAHVSGVVMEQQAGKGSFVKSGDLLMKIGKIENIYLEAYLPKEISDKVQKDMETFITIDKSQVISEESDKEERLNLIGTISEVNVDKLKLELNEDKAVKIKVYNIELIDQVKEGVTYKVGIETDKKEGVLVIPDNVLIDDMYVYVSENNRVVKREIEIGIRDGKGLVEILSGLDTGDKVIVNGIDILSDGDKIKINNI